MVVTVNEETTSGEDDATSGSTCSLETGSNGYMEAPPEYSVGPNGHALAANGNALVPNGDTLVKEEASTSGEDADDQHDATSVTGLPVVSNIDGSPPPDFDRLVSYLGQFGTYQKWLFLWLWIPAAIMSIAVYSSVFLEYSPDYHCSSWNPDTCLQDDLEKLADKRCTVPKLAAHWDNDDNNDNNSCRVEDWNEVQTCMEYTYDKSVFTRTVITDFDIVCSNGFMKTISSTVYMSGMLFGSFVFGWISDAFGRRVAFGCAITTVALGSTLTAFSSDYIMYMFFRFFTSMGGVGCFLISFVLATEFVGTNYRVLVGILIEIPFALGELYLIMLAYFIRDWQDLQLAIGIPFFLVLLYLIKLPESVRWAWTVGKIDIANQVISKMSEINHVEIPEEFLLKQKPKIVAKNEAGMGSLIASVELRGRLVVMAFNWIVATVCYYGLTLNSVGIGSSVFTSFSLSSAMEIPAYIFSAMSVGLWGRKPFLMFVQILSGLSCITAGLVNNSTIQLVASLIGKFGSSAAFAIVFLFTAELFPTSMRNSAVGLCSTLARLGGILAPSVASLGIDQPEIPFLIFGIATLIGGISAYLLPETKGKKLPDSIQEALNMEDVKMPSSGPENDLCCTQA